MHALAIVFDSPGSLTMRQLQLAAPGERDVVVAVEWTGISTGTERLLYQGSMPPFPGLGYPLVPGYEAVGRVVAAGAESGVREGARVFVAGSRGFPDVHCLFGGSANRLVVAGDRVTPLGESIGREGVLLALAATAHHALQGGPLPELIAGHGALGRLLARLVVALGGAPPVVWETDARRRDGAQGYPVRHPDDEAAEVRYAAICDVSGNPDLIDTLIGRLAPGGELTLAGFYHRPVTFDFPLAFRREARLRVAAEWQPADLAAVVRLVADGRLSLAGVLTHTAPALSADTAYLTAFDDAACVKMVLDWRSCA